MSFDETNHSGQPRNTGEWSFTNHALKPKGNEFSFLPPIQSSIHEDSVCESSKNVGGDGTGFSPSSSFQPSVLQPPSSTTTTTNNNHQNTTSTYEQVTPPSTSNNNNGNGQRLPSIKLLQAGLTELQQSQQQQQQLGSIATSSPNINPFSSVPPHYVPINLEGQQPNQIHNVNTPLLNSPSCLNLGLWSLNSPSNLGGSAGTGSYQQNCMMSGSNITPNLGPDSYSIGMNPSSTSRLGGPSHLPSYSFRPIPTISNQSGHVMNTSTNSFLTGNTFPFIDQQGTVSKRKSTDGFETFAQPNANSLNSRSKRYSFSSYSPQIQSKKVQPSTGSNSGDSFKKTSPEEEETFIQRRSSFKEIPIQSIIQHLHLSQRDAAKSLGVSVSTLKRRFYSVRDQIGIDKWPTLSTTTIQNSQQSLSSVLTKYPIISNPPTTTNTTFEFSNSQISNLSLPIQTTPNNNNKEDESSSSPNGISSSASCAPLQNNN